MLSKLLVATVAATAAAAPSWQVTDFAATSIGGVYATSADTCYAAISQNDFGPGLVKTNDGGATWENPEAGGELNTDTARDTEGNQVISTIGGIFVSHNDGPITLLDSRDISFSQNVETFGTNSFGVTGSHYPNGVASNVVNGVALSTDGAKTFEYFDTGLQWDTYIARYSAFPSDSTWYVAQGSWGSSSVATPDNMSNATSWNLHHSIVHEKEAGPRYKKAEGSSVYFGAISKTTDGGKTFNKVFDAKGEYYMNMIDCASEDVCMVVSEGNDNAYALRTENGGKSWETVLTATAPAGASLAACKMLSESEAWVSGGTFEKGMVGWYFHTTDGGKTWDKQVLDQAYSLDLSFADGSGYSTAMKELGSSIAVYK